MVVVMISARQVWRWNGIAASLHVITRTVQFRFHGLEKAVKLEEIGFEPFVVREGMQLFHKRK